MPSSAVATTALVSTAQNGPAARRPQPMGQHTATEYQTAACPLVFVNGAVATGHLGERNILCLAKGGGSDGRAGSRLVIACFLCFVPALRTGRGPHRQSHVDH